MGYCHFTAEETLAQEVKVTGLVCNSSQMEFSSSEEMPRMSSWYVSDTLGTVRAQPLRAADWAWEEADGKWLTKQRTETFTPLW